MPVSEPLALHARIESGEVRLTALHDPQDVYAGDVGYVTGNDWSLTVFNDANEESQSVAAVAVHGAARPSELRENLEEDPLEGREARS